VAPAFATLTADKQAADGALLAHRARLHAHAEEIDLLCGASAERALMDEAAKASLTTARRLHVQRFGSDVLDTYVLRYVGILAAFTAMLPAVVASHVPNAEAVEDPTKYFLTCLHLLVQVGLALKDLVLSFKGIAAARGLAERVDNLVDALATAETSASTAAARGGGGASPSSSSSSATDAASGGRLVSVSGARLTTPNGTELVRDLELSLDAGERLLVRGPNGAGKSSIIRLLAGIWSSTPSTTTSPDGPPPLSWAVPPSARLFLPQRPYVIPRLTLRQNLLYPETAGSAAADDDASLLELLRRVGLARLTDGRAEALDAPGACEGLSPGECQRLSLARVLLRRPAVAVLDEPCASMEEKAEAHFFGEVAKAGVSIITVAHRAQLSTFHTHELSLDGKGGARLAAL
jgi:ABC-type uncharacterized transport system fused permease/ATPase subunit